jgi:hypothetical protein
MWAFFYYLVFTLAASGWMLSQPDIYTMQFGQHAFLIMMGFGLCPLGIPTCVLKHGMSLALEQLSSEGGGTRVVRSARNLGTATTHPPGTLTAVCTMYTPPLHRIFRFLRCWPPLALRLLCMAYLSRPAIDPARITHNATTSTLSTLTP